MIKSHIFTEILILKHPIKYETNKKLNQSIKEPETQSEKPRS